MTGAMDEAALRRSRVLREADMRPLMFTDPTPKCPDASGWRAPEEELGLLRRTTVGAAVVRLNFNHLACLRLIASAELDQSTLGRSISFSSTFSTGSVANRQLPDDLRM